MHFGHHRKTKHEHCVLLCLSVCDLCTASKLHELWTQQTSKNHKCNYQLYIKSRTRILPVHTDRHTHTIHMLCGRCNVIKTMHYVKRPMCFQMHFVINKLLMNCVCVSARNGQRDSVRVLANGRSAWMCNTRCVTRLQVCKSVCLYLCAFVRVHANTRK